jgi:hypothetical protein
MGAPETPSTPAENKEYVAAMLDWIAADANHVYIRVTAAAGLIALFITQIPMEHLEALNRWETFVLFVGLGCLAVAAGLYFTYVNKTHRTRRTVALCLATGTGDPEAIVQALFRRWRKLVFGGGNALFILGVLLLGVVLWAAITVHVPPTH